MSNIYDRKTFAIISHPDAGKTTITEKLLLFGGAIALAGTVKSKKSKKFATSDWMELEKQRGISVTTSVMQFPYKGVMLNLLDTPGHADFSEDTYRTLTAVDSALMVIDAVNGVEARTLKLMEVCSMRDTPIMTFINKLDRDCRCPLELLDEIENTLKISCTAITWPIGMGKSFQGVYSIVDDTIILYDSGKNNVIQEAEIIKGIDSEKAKEKISTENMEVLKEQVELIQGASDKFSLDDYLAGKQTPVFFGSAVNNFGVRELLDMFAKLAPGPQPRETKTRDVSPNEDKFSGFVFKIQANMDSNHRDRIAFMRICSGEYKKGMKVKQVRTGKNITVNNAVGFMAGQREILEQAFPGDIIGLHNHGTISIGDTFTSGEELKYIGLPNFAPELFQVVRSENPLKAKHLQKGLIELSEEGAAQVFRPLKDNKIILGAIGSLQFDVVSHRLELEYNVKCVYTPISIATVRWIEAPKDDKEFTMFKNKNADNLGLDAGGNLVYLAPSMVNLSLAESKWENIGFHNIKDN